MGKSNKINCVPQEHRLVRVKIEVARAIRAKILSVYPVHRWSGFDWKAIVFSFTSAANIHKKYPC